MIVMKPASLVRKKKNKRDRYMSAKPKARNRDVNSADVLDWLDEYLEGNEDEMVRFIDGFWDDQKAVLTYDELVALARDEENIKPMMDAWYQQYSVLIGSRMENLWEKSMEAAVKSNPVFDEVGFTFNAAEERVLDWMHERAGTLITVVTDEQVQAVRYVLLEGKAQRMGSEEMAKYIRPIVGLTRPQASANLRLYNSVKEKLAKDNPGMSQADIEKKAREAAARYAAKQQRYRAQTIARTEMAFAYNNGMYEATRQAVEQGLMPRMQKVWRTAATDRVCEACQELEGWPLEMDGLYWGLQGKKAVSCLFPPMHPRCQCVVEYVEVLGEDGKPVWEERPEKEIPEETVPTEPRGQAEGGADASQSEWTGVETGAVMNNGLENGVKDDIISLSRQGNIYVLRTDDLYERAQKIPPIDGYTDIVAHGDPYSIVFKDASKEAIETNISAKDFAELLDNSEFYTGGNIRLIACQVGAGQGIVPQYLADYFNVDVLAPTETVYIDFNGGMIVANDIEDAKNGRETGYWKLFTSKR